MRDKKSSSCAKNTLNTLTHGRKIISGPKICLPRDFGTNTRRISAEPKKLIMLLPAWLRKNYFSRLKSCSSTRLFQCWTGSRLKSLEYIQGCSLNFSFILKFIVYLYFNGILSAEVSPVLTSLRIHNVLAMLVYGITSVVFGILPRL